MIRNARHPLEAPHAAAYRRPARTPAVVARQVNPRPSGPPEAPAASQRRLAALAAGGYGAALAEPTDRWAFHRALVSAWDAAGLAADYHLAGDVEGAAQRAETASWWLGQAASRVRHAVGSVEGLPKGAVFAALRALAEAPYRAISWPIGVPGLDDLF